MLNEKMVQVDATGLWMRDINDSWIPFPFTSMGDEDLLALQQAASSELQDREQVRKEGVQHDVTLSNEMKDEDT